MDRDKVPGTPEELELAHRHAARRRIEMRNVQYAEAVTRILVELGPLVLACHILQCELVESESPLQPGDVLRPRIRDVNPQQLCVVHLERIQPPVARCQDAELLFALCCHGRTIGMLTTG